MGIMDVLGFKKKPDEPWTDDEIAEVERHNDAVRKSGNGVIKFVPSRKPRPTPPPPVVNPERDRNRDAAPDFAHLKGLQTQVGHVRRGFAVLRQIEAEIVPLIEEIATLPDPFKEPVDDATLRRAENLKGRFGVAVHNIASGKQCDGQKFPSELHHFINEMGKALCNVNGSLSTLIHQYRQARQAAEVARQAAERADHEEKALQKRAKEMGVSADLLRYLGGLANGN